MVTGLLGNCTQTEAPAALVYWMASLKAREHSAPSGMSSAPSLMLNAACKRGGKESSSGAHGCYAGGLGGAEARWAEPAML